MKLQFILSLLAIIIISLFFQNCSPSIRSKSINTDNTTHWSANPNGDSELALLMREMFDHGMRMKKAIKKGEPLVVERNFEEILTATATQPEKVASPEFKAFAIAYINIMERMDEGTNEETVMLYESMVSNCMACHTAFCPGPRMKIKHLYLD